MMRERGAQGFGYVPAVFNDRAPDIQNYQPHGRLRLPSSGRENPRRGCACRQLLQGLPAREC